MPSYAIKSAVVLTLTADEAKELQKVTGRNTSNDVINAIDDVLIEALDDLEINGALG